MDNLAGPSFPRSSLRFQLLLHLDNWLTPAFVTLVLLLLLVKPYFYRYPPGVALGEFLLMLFHAPLQALRSWPLNGKGTTVNNCETPVGWE